MGAMKECLTLNQTETRKSVVREIAQCLTLLSVPPYYVINADIAVTLSCFIC